MGCQYAGKQDHGQAGACTGHQVIARALRANGITHVFGVIGIPVTPLASACHEQGIRFLSFRNEQAAGYAAAAAGYLTHRPAALLTVSGPGFINGIAGAFQECDQVSLAVPYCKAVEQVQCLRTAGDAVARLTQSSMSDTPGPVYLDIPSDVLNNTTPAAALPRAEPLPIPTPPPPSPAHVHRAIQLLNSAKRPLLVVGHAAIFAQATSAVERLATSANIPVLSTPMARGVLSDDHELSATAARSLVLSKCDVAILIGAPLNWQLHHGEPPKWSKDVHFIAVGSTLPTHDCRKAEVAMEGDINAALHALGQAIKPHREWTAWAQVIQDAAKASAAKLERKLQRDAFPLDFYTALRVIRNAIDNSPDRERIVVTSEGANTMDMARILIKAYAAPTRIDAGAWGTMGVGLPGAIAAAAIQPPGARRVPVIALEGDSALGFSMAELETICRYKLPVIVVVFNNEGIYGGDRRTPEQQKRARAGLMASSLQEDPPPTALTAGAKHEEVMRAFRGRGWAVSDAKELAAAFAEALTSGEPCLIDIAIDPMAGRESGSVHDFNRPASKL